MNPMSSLNLIFLMVPGDLWVWERLGSSCWDRFLTFSVSIFFVFRMMNPCSFLYVCIIKIIKITLSFMICIQFQYKSQKMINQSVQGRKNPKQQKALINCSENSNIHSGEREQTVSSSSLVKINFFKDEVNFMSRFRDNLDDLKTESKKMLKGSDNDIQKIAKINQVLKHQIQIINDSILETKISNGKGILQTNLETGFIFQAYENKVQEMNERLTITEECVQEAELIKKQRGDQYFITNYRNFKRNYQAKMLSKNVHLKNLLLTQLIKSIELVLKIQQTAGKSTTPLNNIQKYKHHHIKFKKYRQLENFRKLRPYRSHDKHHSQLKVHSKKQLSLIKTLQSPAYSQYFGQGMKLRIMKLKEKNRQITQRNNLLEMALEEKNKFAVLKNLKNDTNLTFQQKLMKIELEAQIFSKNIEQKLLSAKINKKSHQWPIQHEPQEDTRKRVQSLSKDQKKYQNASLSKTIQSLKEH